MGTNPHILGSDAEAIEKHARCIREQAGALVLLTRECNDDEVLKVAESIVLELRDMLKVQSLELEEILPAEQCQDCERPSLDFRRSRSTGKVTCMACLIAECADLEPALRKSVEREAAARDAANLPPVPNTLLCNTVCPDARYACSNPLGHSGDHVARGTIDGEILRWPAESYLRDALNDLPLPEPIQARCIPHVDTKPTTHTRASVLDGARHATQQREAHHGTPDVTFARIADLWSTILGIDVRPHHVALLLTAVKIARAVEDPTHGDNWIDLAGYAACGGEVALAKRSA